MFCNVLLAAIQIFDPYCGSESFQCSCEPFNAPASAFRSQYMRSRPSDDAQRKGQVDLPRSLQALPGAVALSTQNGFVKQFMAAGLLTIPTELPDELDNSPKPCFHSKHVQASPEGARSKTTTQTWVVKQFVPTRL